MRIQNAYKNNQNKSHNMAKTEAAAPAEQAQMQAQVQETVTVPVQDGVTTGGEFFPFGKMLQFSNDGKAWTERELVGFVQSDEKPFKTAGERVSSWALGREIPPPPVMTVAEIEAKYGIKVAGDVATDPVID